MTVIWDQATYDAAYDVRRPDNVRVSYGRDFAKYAMKKDSDTIDLYFNRLDGIALGLSIPTNSTILFVGCGWGYLMEACVDRGYNLDNLWGTDTSAYIQGPNKSAETRADITSHILDIDITDPGADFRPYIGGNGKFDWLITEQVVESIDAIDLSAFLDACDNRIGPQGEVLHIVTPLLAVWTIGQTNVYDDMLMSNVIDVLAGNTSIRPVSTSAGFYRVDLTGSLLDFAYVQDADVEIRDNQPHDLSIGLRLRPLMDWFSERTNHWWQAAGSHQQMGTL